MQRLFVQTRRVPEHWSNRQIAERVATTLAASCPAPLAKEPLAHQAWHGAAQCRDVQTVTEVTKTLPTTRWS